MVGTGVRSRTRGQPSAHPSTLRRRLGPLLAVATLLAVSCGGGGSGDPSGPEGPADPELPPFPETELAEAASVVAFVVNALGADDGLKAVLWAWERGYSHSQLLALGGGGLELTADGRVLRQGALVEPEESPRGVDRPSGRYRRTHGLRRQG